MPRQPSKIPAEIARHRKPGTQIKRIRGKYYLQRVTSRWDKAAKKVRKVVLEHIGMVTPEGVVPKRTRRVPADAKTYSKEFGATWAVSELTGDIHEALRKHFHGDADWLYVTALLRCVRHCAMRYTEHFYGVSYPRRQTLEGNPQRAGLPSRRQPAGLHHAYRQAGALRLPPQRPSHPWRDCW